MFNKKVISSVLALALVFTSVMPYSAKSVKAAEVKSYDIIEITDFHGTLEDASSLPVAEVLAKNIKDVKAQNPNRTLIVGGGDLYQGSPTSNYLKGVPVQKMLSNIGMEVTTLGNHEFDWGLDTIVNTTMKDSKYSIVVSNLYDKTTGKRAFDPYKIIEKDGLKIAVIGGITLETPSIVLPKYFENYEIKDMATEINSLVPVVKAKGANVVIAVVHEGTGADTKSGAIFDLGNKLVGVDALFGGHSHSIVNATAANGMPIVIANSTGKGFIDMKMTIGANGKPSFSANYVDIYNDKPNGYKAKTPYTDTEVKSIVSAANAEVGPTFDEVIGNYTEKITKAQVASNKWNSYGESQLGNWSTDVIKKAANADVAFQNNGGLRIDFDAPGKITVGTINRFMPFDNTICVIDMTKAQIKKVLEQAFADGGKGIQLSGLKVSYDAGKPSMNRVTSITRADGTSISDTEKLKVATNDFMATGGDGFTGFIDAGGKEPAANTLVLVRDALINDVKATKGIVAKLEERIKAVSNVISVVGTADLHGNIYPMDYFTGAPALQGLAKVSTYVNELRKSRSNTMLVDSGDTIQGTPLVYYYNKVDTKAEYPMMKVMGAMKYDSWTLGNHEFNYGLVNLNRVIGDAEKNNIAVLSANTYKEDGTNYVKPYIIKDFVIGGKTVKVGILGLTTKTIASWENEANYKGLKFNDLVEEANLWVPKMQSEGANVIVATIHSGEEGASDTIPENQVKAVATKVNGINAIICAHTHALIAQDTFKNPAGKTVVVTEPGKYAQNISQVDIAVDAEGNVGAVTSKNVKMDATIAPDTNITDVVAKDYQDATIKDISVVIGNASGEYTGKDQTMKPTAIMDLINTVQMKGANTQLSIAAPLSATAKIPQGDIKVKDIMSVYVFENFLYGVKMNGKQIKAWMEQSAKYYKQAKTVNEIPAKDPELNVPDYNLDFLYGANYVVDLTQPVGSRIKNLTYNGKEIKDTDVFTVAINNYRYNGGGGFMAAAGLKTGDASIVTYDSQKALGDDGQVRSMMIKYISEVKNISPTISNNWTLSTTAVKTTQEVKTIPTVDTKVALPTTAKVISITAKIGLNIRATAKTSAVIYGVFGLNAKVTVEEEVGLWYRIKFNGKDAYIYKQYTK